MHLSIWKIEGFKLPWVWILVIQELFLTCLANDAKYFTMFWSSKSSELSYPVAINFDTHLSVFAHALNEAFTFYWGSIPNVVLRDYMKAAVQAKVFNFPKPISRQTAGCRRSPNSWVARLYLKSFQRETKLLYRYNYHYEKYLVRLVRNSV